MELMKEGGENDNKYTNYKVYERTHKLWRRTSGQKSACHAQQDQLIDCARFNT